MKTDLDSLATAPYVKTDDLLNDSPQLAPWRPAVGIAPQLSDAELVTLAMVHAMLGFTSEARRLRHAGAHLRHLCGRDRIPALTAVIRHNDHSGQPVMRALTAYDH